MRRKTLKRQRKQRGGHPDDADDPDNVRKGLDALVTYFLYEIEIKNQKDGDGQHRKFLKHGEYERKKLVDAYYEYGADKDASVKFDIPTMIAIALLRNYMREDTAFDAKKEYGVITIKDLKHNRYSTPGRNRTELLGKAADAFQIKMSSENSNIFFESMNLTSRIYKALDPEKQMDFISKLFDKLKQYEITSEVKAFDGKTTIDIARGHLLDKPKPKPEPEPEKKEELTLLARLNTFENALWFIILYIFSVVKFSYKNTDRGFFLSDRIKLREKDTDDFRRYIIEEAEILLRETDEGKHIEALYQENMQEKYDQMPHTYVQPKIGGTRKRRMRGRATK